MSDSPWIIEPTEQTFTADVVDRSAETPVVVDFWAPWCGPCRILTPVLEKLVNEFAGRFLLAKINTDAQPGLAAAFQVQSIPTVVGIRDRKVIDLFQGALPEDALREWLNALLPSAAERLLEEAARLEQESPDQAEAKYREAIEAEPDNAAAKIGLMRLFLGRQDFAQAQQQLDDLEQRGFLEPEAEKIKSQLHLQQTAASSGGAAEAQRLAEASPDDLELQVKLAEALAAEGRTREALDVCLAVVSRQKSGPGEQAKAALLDILNTVDDAELASDYRRKLATLLY
jgi:putative thioredoxin